VSVEDRRFGVPRIAELRAAPRRTRFLSLEPLLEDVGELGLDGIHWVIVGGESGAGDPVTIPAATWCRARRTTRRAGCAGDVQWNFPSSKEPRPIWQASSSSSTTGLCSTT